MPAPSLQSPPMGLLARAKSAMGVLATGKLPNPLASEPQDRSRAALVRELNDWCVEERKFWKPIFDRIRQEQKFAAGRQWPGEYKNRSSMDTEDYVGDMVQQFLNRKTAALYAKNPKPEGVLHERMNFTVWDGDQATIDNCKALIAQVAPQAMQAHEAELQGQQVPPPPAQMQQDLAEAQAILADYQQGMAEKKMLEKIAQTGELLIQSQWRAQSPDMLISAKQAVTRVITSRVAFVQVMYKREEQTVASDNTNAMNFDERLKALQSELAMIESGVVDADDPRVEQARLLRVSIAQQQQEQQQAQTSQPPPAEEGVVHDWLQATSVIVDRRCKCLREFVGAHRVAKEILWTVAECEKKYGVNLRDSGAKIYTESGDGWRAEDRTDYDQDEREGGGKKFANKKVCVWHIEDIDTGLRYVICDGVKDFLVEPETNSPEVNRFWSIVAVAFNVQEVEENDPENDVTIYPRSDVRLMMPMQINVNVAGQDRRKHRAANRPAWVGVKSKFASTAGQNDLEKLARPRDGHDVLMMEGLLPNEKISDFIQPLPKQPFDVNLYENGTDSQAMMLATGMQASDLGEQRPDEKATGQNIAAQARATSDGSNIGDLDYMFSTLAQMDWEMLIQEMHPVTVQTLVGRGAVWPALNRQQIADSIYFQIEAGSMGRPNQVQEVQNYQAIAPQLGPLMQQSGRDLEPLIKEGVKRLGDKLDVDDFLKPAQVPAAPPPQQQKPASLAMSLNVADLPPEEQEQAVQQFGIKPAPPASRLLNKIGHAAAVKAAHENANGGPAQPGAPQGQPVAGS